MEETKSNERLVEESETGSQESQGSETVQNPKAESQVEGNRLYISRRILKSLPATVKALLPKMPAEQQEIFLQEYKRKKKSVGVAYLFLLLILGMPYGYLHKWGLQIVYWLTGGGVLIWFLILLFKLPSMVRNYNKDVATDVMRDLKIMGY